MKREIFSRTPRGRGGRDGRGPYGPLRLLHNDKQTPDERDLAKRSIALARYMRVIRKERDKHLPIGLAGEPAWDMLLDLYIAHDTASSLSIDALCMSSGLPHSTAIRWVAALESSGFAARDKGEDEGAETIRITPEAYRRIELYLADSVDRLNHAPDLCGRNLSVV